MKWLLFIFFYYYYRICVNFLQTYVFYGFSCESNFKFCFVLQTNKFETSLIHIRQPELNASNESVKITIILNYCFALDLSAFQTLSIGFDGKFCGKQKYFRSRYQQSDKWELSFFYQLEAFHQLHPTLGSDFIVSNQSDRSNLLCTLLNSNFPNNTAYYLSYLIQD